jgi:acylphosphatase
MKRKEVVFSGNVQGVGFRYTSCRVAGGFDVTGFVRNLPDGDVQCVVEGEADQVDAFCRTLSRRMAGYVGGGAEQEAPFTGEFEGFSVRY